MLGQKLRDLAVLPTKPPNGFTPEARVPVEGIEWDAFDQARRRQWRVDEFSRAVGGRKPEQRQHQYEGLTCLLRRMDNGLEQPFGDAELSVGSHQSVKVAGADGSISP